MVKSEPPNPSITATAEGNSALDVELQEPPGKKKIINNYEETKIKHSKVDQPY